MGNVGYIKEKIGEFELVIATKKNEDGALLWNEDIEDKYNKWLDEIYKEKKDVFTIQKISIPVVVMEVIDRIAMRNPGCTRSDVLRAMVRVYLDRVETNEKYKSEIERCFVKKDFQDKLQDMYGLEVVKVRFLPKGYIDIKAQGDLFDLKPKEVVEQIVYRIAACFYDFDWIEKETNNYLAA